MTTPTVSRPQDSATIKKYAAPDGKLYLSPGFFQRLFASGGSLTEHPVLQIHNLKFTESKENNSAARVRLSDGSFTYSVVFFADELIDQMKADNFETVGNPGDEDKDCFPVFVIKKFSFAEDFQVKGKTPLRIQEYEYITKCHRIQGAKALPADLESYKGYKPSPVLVPVMTTVAPARPAVPPPARQASGMAGITPISAITPYVTKWKILGTCTGKEDLKTIHSNAKGPLKVFNFELTDSKGDTIRVTAFGEAAEKVSTQVQSRCCYYLSNCSVRSANKRFNGTGHDYELTLRSAEDVQPCLDTVLKAPELVLRSVPLKEICQHSGTSIDVLAVVEKVNPVNEFTARSGNHIVKRDVLLIDQSCAIVTFTLWNETAKEFDEDAKGHVIGIKGALVKEFNGSFSLGSNRFEMDPDLPQSGELLEWYENERDKVETVSLSSMQAGGAGNLVRDLRFLGTANALEMGRHDDKGVYMTLKVYFNGIKTENAVYQACPSEGCQKKVILEHNEYRCEKCSKTTPNFKYNYMVQAEVFDLTGQVWVTIFSKAAESLLGMSAQDLGELKERDPTAYEEVFQAVKFKPFTIRVRAKSETYNEEERIRYTVFDVNEVNWEAYTPLMTDTLEKLTKL